MSRSPANFRTTCQAILVAGFATMTGIICYRTSMHVARAVQAGEARDVRPLAQFRPTTWRSWRELPEDFEAAFNPRVEGRDIAVRRFSRFKVSLLGVSSTPRVQLGTDGWLFYHHEGESNYFGPGDPRLAERLAEWTRALPEWHDWLRARGIRLVMVVAPNKQSVYPEYLPAIEQKRTEPTPADQLIAAWRSRGVDVCDLREPVREAKPRGRLYFQTDTHWVPLGARVGYEATARSLGLTPMGDERFRGGPGPTKAGDLARLLGWWPEPAEPFDHLEIVGPQAREKQIADAGDETARLDYLDARAFERAEFAGPRVVLFHDSFGDGIYSEMLAEHARRLVAVPSNHLDPGVIEREKPDIVVFEIVERLFQGIGARRPSDPPRRSMVR